MSKISCQNCIHSQVDRNHNLWCVPAKEKAVQQYVKTGKGTYKIPDNIEACFEDKETEKIKNKSW